MPSTTISPQVRIVSLVGILVIALAGSAFFVLHRHSSTPTTPTTPAAPQSTPSNPVHVVPPTVDPLLPAPLRSALERYPVVVAGFYNPDSPVDSRTIEEARAGAATAHAGFVSVNVLNDAVAGPLTALLPSGQILPNPGFIVYTRPGKIAYRSDGYLDRAGVAQAVKDSR
ncbi:MAG TPA: hypothetical protein VNC40_09730 [Gaiellaceae bacterium]|nr:hypothetical protein [Gaiellaceae bacterium]